ncbi:MAG: hypothetical protein HRT88_20945, partial [Lentisphaeraceae bacterium]|nr:hypothetical protein [Lentisphaeraceae bacterium]
LPMVDKTSITIDGSDDDWQNITPIFEDFGAKSNSTKPNVIDVQKFSMAHDKNKLYIFATLNKVPIKDQPSLIFALAFDSDHNKKTGSKAYPLFNKAKITGFNHRLAVRMTNTEIKAELYSEYNNFGQYAGLIEDISLKGDKLEIAIPLDEIGINSDDIQKIRILFAEYANHTIKDGYSHKSFEVDLSTKLIVPIDIWQLMLITVWVLTILCAFTIAPKAGLSNKVAALNFIPFIGQVAFLFILAFKPWPIHKDYHFLEREVKDLEKCLKDDF